MGQYSLIPPLSEFFCPLLFLSTVSVIFVNHQSWLPPPRSKLELYLCIGQIWIKRWMCTLLGLYITQPQENQQHYWVSQGCVRKTLLTPGRLRIGSWNMFLHTKSSSFYKNSGFSYEKLNLFNAQCDLAYRLGILASLSSFIKLDRGRG